MKSGVRKREIMVLFDSELNVMEVLWKEGEIKASQICKILEKEIGWNRNTTYTVIKKCVKKGYIERKEPDFVCKAILSKQEVESQGISKLIKKLFGNSKSEFLQAFLGRERLSKEDIQELKNFMDNLK